MIRNIIHCQRTTPDAQLASNTPGDEVPTLDSPAHDRPAVLDSATLFNGATEIVIRHGGREYRLRRTRLDKLILTA